MPEATLSNKLAEQITRNMQHLFRVANGVCRCTTKHQPAARISAADPGGPKKGPW